MTVPMTSPRRQALCRAIVTTTASHLNRSWRQWLAERLSETGFEAMSTDALRAMAVEIDVPADVLAGADSLTDSRSAERATAVCRACLDVGFLADADEEQGGIIRYERCMVCAPALVEGG